MLLDPVSEARPTDAAAGAWLIAAAVTVWVPNSRQPESSDPVSDTCA